MTPDAKKGGYPGPMPEEHRNSPLPENPDARQGGHYTPNSTLDELPALVMMEAPRVNSKRWARHEYTREEFTDQFQPRKVPVRSDKNGPAYVGGSFLDENAPRGKHNMRERWIVALDADDVTPEARPLLVKAVRGLGYGAVIHATHSSTASAPRCRVLFPLSAPLPAAEYPEVANALMGALEVPGAAWDTSCNQAERAMYWPSTPKAANYWVEFVKGAPLDAAEFMAERGLPTPVGGQDAPAVGKRSPGSLPGIVGAFNRVYDVAGAIKAYALPYTQEGPGRWRYNGAHSTGGLSLVEGHTDLAISRHANADPACIRDSRGHFRAVTAFDLAALHLFGHLDSEADRAKGPSERAASQAAMQQQAAQDHAVMREYAGVDFTQEPVEGRTRTVIAKTAEASDSALADWCEPRLAGRVEYVNGEGFRIYSPSRGTWDAASDAAAACVVEKELGEWYVGIVASGDSKRIQRAAKYLNQSKVKAVTQLLQGRLMHEASEYDQDPDVLNVGNGVVDLRTGELHPHAAAYRCTRHTPVPYDPDATHEDWAAALAALPVEVHAWFHRWVGQATTGYTAREDHTMLGIAAGIGANGKTTLLTALRFALGTYAGTASMDLLVANQRNNGNPNNTKMALFGKRFVLVEELPEGRLDGVQVKAITGTELIRGNAKFRDEFEWRATHSLIVTTNNLPTVSEFSEGLWRRPFVLEFPYRFTLTPTAEADRPGDAGLTGRLLAPDSPAMPAALAWAVRGAVEFYANGKRVGAMPTPISAATTAWQEQSDVLLAFASERLVKDAGAVIPGSDLYAAFETWLADQGAAPWSQRTFRGRIASHGYFRDVKAGMHRWKGLTLSRWPAVSEPPKGDKVRGFRGVRFRTSEDERREREAELAGRGLHMVTGTDDTDLI